MSEGVNVTINVTKTSDRESEKAITKPAKKSLPGKLLALLARVWFKD
ncbi:hypothetical protein [Leisingera sp. ANG-M1]|nr:hypothetical protein [Leisingera sp. ANG-M1]